MASLAEMLAGLSGDPEAQGAAASSNAMRPATQPFVNLAAALANTLAIDPLRQGYATTDNVLSGRGFTPEDALNMTGLAMGSSAGFGGLGAGPRFPTMETPAQKIMRLNDLTARNDMDLVKQGADNFFQNHTSGQIIPAYDAQGNLLPVSPPPIRAYHGSPYDFDAFDASKIGSGEGAQAYGHGLYFAESEPVAQSYKQDLGAIGAMDTLDAFLKTNQGRTMPAADVALRLRDTKAAPLATDEGSVAALQKLLPNYRSDAAVSGADLAHYRYLNDAAERLMPGKMYEVNINADPEQFLNWDKPLSEQPHPATQRFFDDPRRVVFKPQMTGAELYRLIDEPGTGAASDAMLRGGIPGIRYLDQGSRASGNGTNNYVVFDPKIIDIVKKYGLAGLLATGAATMGGGDKE